MTFQTQTAASPATHGSYRPLSRPVLQKKCTCGGTPGPGGECEECARKRRLGLQTKLRINTPGDVYEREADRVADQVMAMRAHPAVSNASPQIQCSTRQYAEHTEVPASVEQVLARPGVPLEPALRQQMEQRIGHDFSKVRVHSDADAARSAQDVGANAYTVSNNIVFGAGQFTPGTSSGQRLLAHELTHVVQQSGSSGTMLQRQPRGAAGGCGICMNDPGGRAAGDIAHTEVQGAFTAVNPDIVAERPVSGIPNSGIDLSYERRRSGEHALLIGEIKPLDDAGRQADIGRTQLQDYAREMMLSGEYDEVYRMQDAPPPGPLYFHNPMNPAGCPAQIITVRLTEPGLYQYYCEPPFSQLVRNPSCRCTRPEDEEPPSPPVPPVWVRPGDQPGSSDTKGKGGDQPSKGNGEPSKGDRKPSRTPSRDQPQQPTFRLPDWFPGTALLAALGAIVAWLSKNPLGRLGAFLGTLLGRFLVWLGLSIGIVGTAGASTGGGGGGSSTDGGGDGSSTGKPKGDTVKVPGKDTVIVPGDTVTVPGGTITVPGDADPAKPPAGTTRVPSRTPVAPTKKKAPPAKTPLPLKQAPKRIKLASIEGLRLDTLSVGKLAMVEIDPGGPKEQVVVLKVKSVQPKGSDVTVEFESVLLECSLKGDKCSSGGNIYTVTHSYRGAPEDALVARAVKEVGNTEGMDETVKQLEKLMR